MWSLINGDVADRILEARKMSLVKKAWTRAIGANKLVPYLSMSWRFDLQEVSSCRRMRP